MGSLPPDAEQEVWHLKCHRDVEEMRTWQRTKRSNMKQLWNPKKRGQAPEWSGLLGHSRAKLEKNESLLLRGRSCLYPQTSWQRKRPASDVESVQQQEASAPGLPAAFCSKSVIAALLCGETWGDYTYYTAKTVRERRPLATRP